jgi:SAM-dependent methyltransferase
MAVTNATSRFSSRVGDYLRYRPGYPPEVLELLRSECRLTPKSVIADVASGTGIFTRLLLENGNSVFGVEPNREMRAAGEQFLQAYGRFTSIAGTAEATTLAAQSVDMITAAQAAHWFNRSQARTEFVRILKPEGWLVLVWNERKTDGTAFLGDYERLLLTHGTDYREVRHEHTTAEVAHFFGPSPFRSRKFETSQECDYQALEGRLLSSSYTPQPGHPGYEPMLGELRSIFAAHQVDGRVVLRYDTRVFFGRLA